MNIYVLVSVEPLRWVDWPHGISVDLVSIHTTLVWVRIPVCGLYSTRVWNFGHIPVAAVHVDIVPGCLQVWKTWKSLGIL